MEDIMFTNEITYVNINYYVHLILSIQPFLYSLLLTKNQLHKILK